MEGQGSQVLMGYHLVRLAEFIQQDETLHSTLCTLIHDVCLHRTLGSTLEIF